MMDWISVVTRVCTLVSAEPNRLVPLSFFLNIRSMMPLITSPAWLANCGRTVVMPVNIALIRPCRLVVIRLIFSWENAFPSTSRSFCTAEVPSPFSMPPAIAVKMASTSFVAPSKTLAASPFEFSSPRMSAAIFSSSVPALSASFGISANR